MRLIRLFSIILSIICIFYTCEKQDVTAPTVAISNIEENRTIYGTVVISVEATDNTAVEKVELWLDNEYSGIVDDSEPFELKWNTSEYENKVYSVFVRGYDVNRNISDTEPINLLVDNEGPVISISSITDNDIVSDAVIVSVSAIDNDGVDKIELWIDGEYSGIADAIEPYELEWNTIGYENKTYSLFVRGYDVNNNISETSPISIMVDNAEDFIIPASINSTIHVKSEPEFRTAIQNDNTYVILDNDITLNTSAKYRMGNGVIINGNGGKFGIDGKILYANGALPSGAFLELANNSEIWGIQLIGDYSNDSKGISAVDVSNIKIYNSEITGFTNYGIKFGENISSTYKKGYITACFIHDNSQAPYGYGIVINKNSEVYISKNKFQNNRHHIASRDHKDSTNNDYLGVRYEASFNIVLENTEDEEAHFDVHGNESYGACGTSGFLWDHGQAGNWIKIHHNIFLGNNNTHILIRGVPVSTVSNGGGYRIYSNNFGPNMAQISTCADLSSLYSTAAIVFTDQNIIVGDNFNKYVTIYDNY